MYYYPQARATWKYAVRSGTHPLFRYRSNLSEASASAPYIYPHPKKKHNPAKSRVKVLIKRVSLVAFFTCSSLWKLSLCVAARITPARQPHSAILPSFSLLNPLATERNLLPTISSRALHAMVIILLLSLAKFFTTTTTGILPTNKNHQALHRTRTFTLLIQFVWPRTTIYAALITLG